MRAEKGARWPIFTIIFSLPQFPNDWEGGSNKAYCFDGKN